MIAHSNAFKDAIIRLGRDIHIRIEYYSIVYNLETEDDKLIITQDNMELLTEPIEGLTPSGLLDEEEIMRLNRNNLGELFRTYMKSFDLETPHRFNVGDKMNISIGTSIDEDTIEYLKYGKYFVYQRTYNEDTRTYTYTLCDSMLFTMIPYDNDAVFEDDDEIDCETAINRILTLCNLDANISSLVNGDKIIYKETFEGVDMTYRDILDMIMQSQGCSLLISYDDEQDKDIVITKSFSSQSVDTINEDILADKNVKTGDKFGKINSLLFKRANGNDNLERKDDTAIEQDGLFQYIIENNYILDQENRQDYIDNLFNKIKNVEYYTCNIDLIGLGYIEYMDTFTIETPDGIYNCLCLKNTSNISNGMKENFTTEAPVEKKREYGSTTLSDKDATILVNKLKSEIVLKTDSDGKISQVRLDSSGDDGSLVEVSADNIKLEGYTTINGNFKVDLSGNMECANAKITGAEITGGRISMTNVPSDSSVIQIDGTNGTNSLYPMGYYIHNSNDGSVFIGKSSSNFGMSIYKAGSSQQTGFEMHLRTSNPILRVIENGSGYGIDAQNGVISISDKKAKENIVDIEQKKSIDIITNLNPVEFNYKEQNKKHRGLIAQEVIEALENNGIKEEIYAYDEEKDLYSLNYEEFIPDLINCVKYQQEQIEELKKEIQKLKEDK